MDHLTLDEMKRLAAHKSSPAITIYIPTHRRGREIEQDPIRFSNQLRAVEARLADMDMGPRAIEAFLAPAQALLDDESVWQHSQDGLAVFLDEEEFHAYRLPFEVATRTVFADRFFLNPLLPLFTNNGHFFILALSENESRLFEGTRFSVGEIDMPKDAPATKSDVTARRESYSDQEARTMAGAERRRVGQWLNTLDKALMPIFADSNAPLVVMGDISLLPIYREVTNYAHVVADGPRGNPEMLSAKELHEQAWPFVEEKFRADLDEVLSEYGAQIANGRAIAGLDEVVPAALLRRVQIALLPPGLEVWGTVSHETGAITRTAEDAPGALEIEGLIAAHTFLNGGKIFAVEREQMPEKAEAAAILRF